MLAARAQWKSAMRVADRLPGDDVEVTALRVAPRTMLVSTELFVGADPDNELRFAELRRLTAHGNDHASLGLAMAGRIMTFIVNSNRIPEATLLAAELDTVVEALVFTPAAEMEIIYTALAFARWANCELDATLKVIGRSLELELEAPSVDRAVAYAISGLTEVCLGDLEKGIAHIRAATELARAMPPVSFSAIFLYWGMLAGMGLHVAVDLVEEAREALARAESFGDRFGIIAAQWTYGTLLLQSGDPRRDEAVDLLERAQSGIVTHHLQGFALAIIGPQLALEEARCGRRDEAIDTLRGLVALYRADAQFPLLACPAKALCELLIARGAPGDLSEAADIIEGWRPGSPDTTPMDRWTHRVRALLAAQPAGRG